MLQAAARASALPAMSLENTGSLAPAGTGAGLPLESPRRGDANTHNDRRNSGAGRRLLRRKGTAPVSCSKPRAHRLPWIREASKLGVVVASSARRRLETSP